ncbi:carbohydrate ABC transporter permease [bacterium]|nr:MAG: carbohydrate ABC transporter permease [bacterium]
MIKGLVLTLLILGAVAFSVPLIWTVSAALKTAAEYHAAPEKLIPDKPTLENFGKAWTALPFNTFLRNTIVITVLCTIGQVLSSSLVAYGFARFEFKGRNLLFGLLLATMMLPGQVTSIPVFMIWRELRAIDTFIPLVLPSFLGGAFNVFMLRQFLMGIPKELDEAAMVDGASYPRIWWSVLLPAMGPALATVGVFTFLGQWDNFEGPLIYLNSPDRYTVAIGLRMFQDTFGGDFEQVMAATLVHIVPTIVIFFLAQKYFVRGIATSGLGGR